MAVDETEVIEAGAPEDIGDDLAQMFEGLGEEAMTLDIWRRALTPPRKFEFMDNMHLEGFSLAAVANQFGGGVFQIRAKQADGKYIKNTTRTFQIGGPPQVPVRSEESADVPPDQLATLTTLMAEIANELRARHALPQAGGDPMAMALELSKAMRESASEAAQQVRDMMGTEGKADPLELVERVLDLQERLGGLGGGGGDGTNAMMNTLGRELIGLFRTARGAEAGGPGAPPAHQPGGTPDPATGAPAPAANPARPAWAEMLAPWIPDLIRLATENRDPYTYSNVVQDQLGDRALDRLGAVIVLPGFAETFYLHFPAALPHRPWFDELLQALRDDLTGGPDETDETVEGETPRAAIPADIDPETYRGATP